MLKLTRILSITSIAAALCLGFSGQADAARGASQARQAAAPKAKVSGQRASAAIRAKRAKQGKSNLHLKIRRTQEHAKLSEFTAANGNGKVTKYQVSQDGKMVREAGGRVSQAQGRAIASSSFRRENGKRAGQFVSFRDSGTTGSGNFRYRSKSNPRETVVVDANTGRARNYDPGRR